jgi:hypothetical protein
LTHTGLPILQSPSRFNLVADAGSDQHPFAQFAGGDHASRQHEYVLIAYRLPAAGVRYRHARAQLCASRAAFSPLPELVVRAVDADNQFVFSWRAWNTA